MKQATVPVIAGLLLPLLLIFHPPAAGEASELVYQPVNPSFGGLSMNGSVLMGSASAQNTFRDEEDLLADFENQLTRRILSSLALKITDSVFGEDGLSSGSYNVGDISIEVNDGADGVEVSITDYSTGGSTTINIPHY